MDKLSLLKAEKIRLEGELEELRLPGGWSEYPNALMIDIATIENEISDLEFARRYVRAG